MKEKGNPIWNRPLLLVCATATLLSLDACNNQAPKVNTASIEVGTYAVNSQSVNLTTTLPGRTAAVLTAEVRPQVSGIILKRMFTEGSDVHQGQQLYQIDPAPYQAAYDKAEAQLATSQQLALRDRKLMIDNAVSRQSVDDATAAYRQAAADVEMARINLKYTKVYAPISGFIGRSAVTEGALVTNGQANALATVRQLDPIYVDVTETSNEMLRLRGELDDGKLKRAGQNAAKVDLALDNGMPYKLRGALAFSEVNVDQGTSTVTMRAIFPNPSHILLPGMFVHARVEEGIAENSVVVPEQAVARDTTGAPYVWIVQDGKAEIRKISTSRTVGNTWLVTSGLKSGDVIVAEGTQNLSEGASVSAFPADTVHIDLGTSASVTTNSPMKSASAASSPTAGA